MDERTDVQTNFVSGTVATEQLSASGATGTRTFTKTGPEWTVAPRNPGQISIAVQTSPVINRSSGSAARNGTTSHTVDFGFTSTTGNLLVFLAGGAVTHDISGWTQRLAPVNSGELAVFTKTSAGESSATVTHNGSNYSIGWAVYEFPAGTTYTDGAEETAADDTWPALTGLPGTEQFLIAGLERVAGSTAATGFNASDWGGGGTWVEDLDSFVADNGSTDGYGMAVVSQSRYTSTSITPTATINLSGSWTTTDRQKVVFALDVPAGGSNFTETPSDAVGLTDDADAVKTSPTIIVYAADVEVG
jgi:hypothetical protein